MGAAKLLLGVTATCIAALAITSPGLAHPHDESALSEARDRATNQALLTALRQRRAELSQKPDAEHRRDAIAFLDRQIDRMSNQAMLGALQQRRAELAAMPVAEHRRYALEYLDGQIATLRSKLVD